MKLTPLTGTAARWAAGLLAAAGLTVGSGTHPAAADHEVPAPVLLKVILQGQEALVTYRDNSDSEVRFVVELLERDHPDVTARHDLRAVPGTGRVATYAVAGVTPGVAYCARLYAVEKLDTAERILHSTGSIDYFSNPSNTVCADPAVQALAPGLVLERVGGREEREWALVKDQTPAYLVALRNDGGDAAGTVVVDIATSGVLTLAQDQTLVRLGWEAAGFTCEPTPPSGGANAGLRCTGGSLKQGERTDPAILVRVTGPGYGYIHASVGVSGGPAEAVTSDNEFTLGVRVY